MSAPTVPNIQLRPRVASGQARFYWAPPTSDGGSAVLYYTLAEPSIPYSQALSSSVANFIVSSLSTAVNYTFTLTATNANGTSPAATFRTIQTGVAPFGPTSTVGSTLNVSTALVQWNLSTIPAEGGPRWFLVTAVAGTAGFSSVKKSAYIYERARTFPIPSTGIGYQYLVQAINDTGYCPPFAYTSSFSFTPIDPLSPSSFVGLSFWLDATQLTGSSNGTVLTGVVDRTSNALFGVAVSSPTFATNAIGSNGAFRFQSASNHYINFGNHLNPGLSPQAVMAVMRYSTTADGYIISKAQFSGASNRWAFGRDNTNLVPPGPPGFAYYLATNAGGFVNVAYSDTSLSTQMAVGNWNRSTIQMHRNGSTALISTYTAADTLNSSFALVVGATVNGAGGFPAQAGTFFNGDIGEILVFNSNLSQYNRQRFEGYLAWKWGLTANLPATHPFKSARPGVSEPAFLPNQIDGLELWLDAADNTTFTVTGTSSLAGWADKSPYQKVTAVSANRPDIVGGSLGGYSTILFTSTSQNLVSSVFLQACGTADYAVFAVWRPTVSTIFYNTILGLGPNTGASGNVSLAYISSTKSYGIEEFGVGAVGNSTLSNGWSVHVGARYGSSIHAWHNGSYQNSVITTASTVSTNITATGIQIGGGAGRFASGELAEALVYSGNVTPFNKQKIEGYLAWKWGLQSSLSAAHPFRNTRPGPSTIFSPTLFSSVRAWYDGADPGGNGILPASGSTIGVWVDKSPASNNVSSISTGATYLSDYPRGFLNFNGSTNAYLFANSSFLTSQYFTAFIVERLQSSLTSGTDATFNASLLAGTSGTNNQNLLFRYLTTSNATNASFNYFGNDLAFSAVSAYSNTFTQPTRIWTLTQRVSNRAMLLNGSTLVADTNNTLLGGWTGARIGNDPAVASGRFYNGNIKEVMFYVGEMDPNDRQTFEGYLAWKWDQEQFLPQPTGRHNYRYFNVNTSTGSAVFDPRSVGDLRTWLDASDPTNFDLIGTSSIVRWLDKSDYKNHYSTINASSLTRLVDGGRPAVFLTGSNALYAVNNFYATANVTIAFIVAKLDPMGAGVYGTLWGYSPSSEITVRYINGVLQGGPGVGAAEAANANDWSASPSVNGSATLSTFSTTYANYHLMDGYGRNISLDTGWKIGQWRDPTRNFVGKVCEVIVYQSTLTTADRQKVQGYLSWKWGLQNTLPLDHPYRYVNIYQSTVVPNALPFQMPGLNMWLDGADGSTITQTTSSISQWRDKSGFGNNLTQLSTVAQPLMTSNNYIRFTQGRHFDIPQRAINNAATYTMFFQFIPVSTTNYILGKQYDGINTYTVLSMTSTVNTGGGVAAGPTPGAMHWRTINSGPNMSTTSSILFLGSSITMSLDFDGTTANFYRFGSSFGSFANAGFTVPAVTNATNFKMGMWFSPTTTVGFPPSSISHFQMGEFLFYNSTLGTFQRQRLEGYLAWKWGTQAQLPTTHPYYSYAPS